MQTADHVLQGLTHEQLLASAFKPRGRIAVLRCPPPCSCPHCEHSFRTLDERSFRKRHYDKCLADTEAAAVLALPADEIACSYQSLQQSLQNKLIKEACLNLFIAKMETEMETHEFWLSAHSELQYVREVSNCFRDFVHPGTPLPQKVDTTLDALGRLLLLGMSCQVKQLEALIYERSAFDGVVGASVDGFGIPWRRMSRDFIPDDNHSGTKVHQKNKMFWLLYAMLGDPESRVHDVPYYTARIRTHVLLCS